MKWKIGNFTSRMADTVDIIYSGPFYTGKNGYKLNMQLHLNGCEQGRNSHISLCMATQKGEYDDTLIWPTSFKVEFTLLNTAQGDNHKSVFRSKPLHHPGFSGQDATDAAVSDGLFQFIRHETVQQYVKDDTIFIKCEVAACR